MKKLTLLVLIFSMPFLHGDPINLRNLLPQPKKLTLIPVIIPGASSFSITTKDHYPADFNENHTITTKEVTFYDCTGKEIAKKLYLSKQEAIKLLDPEAKPRAIKVKLLEGTNKNTGSSKQLVFEDENGKILFREKVKMFNGCACFCYSDYDPRTVRVRKDQGVLRAPETIYCSAFDKNGKLSDKFSKKVARYINIQNLVPNENIKSLCDSYECHLIRGSLLDIR